MRATMRTGMRCGALLAVLALAVPGCGSGGDTALVTRRAIEQYVLFFAPESAGEVEVAGLKNLSSAEAVVRVTGYASDGTMAFVQDFDGEESDPFPRIPPFGEVHLSIPPIAGVSPGWVRIETRDPVTFAHLPTTGFIEPFFRVELPGPQAEGSAAGVFEMIPITVPIHEFAQEIQIVNGSHLDGDPGDDEPLSVAITFFDFDGDVVSTTTLTGVDELPPAGSHVVIPPPLLVGSARIAPIDAPGITERLAVATRAGASVVYAHDFEGSVQLTGSALLSELALEFGQDISSNVRDFVLVATNATDDDRSITIHEIHDQAGLPILTVPRSLILGPRDTVYLGTTNAESFGLESGQNTPFLDIFGSPFASLDLDRFRMQVTGSAGVIYHAINFDPAFFDANLTVRPSGLTHDALAIDILPQPFIVGGLRNYVTITNPNEAAIQVIPRVFTPGGTEYLLPSFFVGGNGRTDFSPDGTIYTEDATDPSLPAVSFISMQFSSAGAFGIAGRRERRTAEDILIAVTPIIVRPLD